MPGSDLAQLRTARDKLNIDYPQVIFDLRVGMALSTIMLTEKNHKSASGPCAISKFYLISAREALPNFKEATPEDKARLRGYLDQVNSQINAAC
jgi:hypothetical protein